MNSQNPLHRKLGNALTCLFFAALGYSHPSFAGDSGYNACTKSKKIAFLACSSQVLSDALLARAKCSNLAEKESRKSCIETADALQQEGREACVAQNGGRGELCRLLGEAPFDPTGYWKAENFVDPRDIGKSIKANAFFPLVPGTRLFESEDETVKVTVTGDTKLIAGVTCLVVTDTVEKNGQLLEDTIDWFAQDIHGNVWYCGEISKNYEMFVGDAPEAPELVHIDGSWKAFRDGALPGVVMPAKPVKGTVYRQEMMLGSAEDAAKVIATKADGLLRGDTCTEDAEEIAALMDSFCNKNCVVTNDFTPLSPGSTEHKYYAPGLGFVLEVKPDGECLVIDD